MPLTPETLPKHELAGLRVRVVEATDPARVGTAGVVVDETANTLLIEPEERGSSRVSPARRSGERGSSGVTQVPKLGATFEFRIDEAAEDRETHVTVDGAVLCARPAERTENGVDSKWR